MMTMMIHRRGKYRVNGPNRGAKSILPINYYEP
jgi:hypothetical protein